MKTTLRSVLPGVALVGFTIGTGSVTSMAKAGADFGMALLWTLLISCGMSYVLFTAFGELAVLTRRGPLEVIRRSIHPGVAYFILLAVSINVSVSVMGVMGIVADVLYEWSLTFTSAGISPLVWGSSLSLAIFVFLHLGSFKGLEKLLAGLAGIMGVCFLINAAIVCPSVDEVCAGLVPRVPRLENDPSGSAGYLLAASMVGTTVAPVLFLFRGVSIREQGWEREDLDLQRRDALLSAVLIFLVSAAVMASAAGSLHGRGTPLHHVSDMVDLLKPFAGTAAATIFVLGLTAAGLSSQFPNVASVACMRRDFLGLPMNLSARGDRILLFVVASLGLVVPVFSARPVGIMLVSQALNAVVLPVTVICVWRLLNDKEVTPQRRPTMRLNVALALIVAFSLATAAMGCYGLCTHLL